MVSQNLVHNDGLDGPAGDANWEDRQPSEGNVWQKHVLTALWIVLGVVMVVAVALGWAVFHGYFAGHTEPTPPFPNGWQ
jgi:hypothetical protein